MALSKEQKLEIYRQNLKRYEEEGKTDLVEVQCRLIKRIEDE